MFVSIGLRLRVEAEAMNMVEPLGAYTRHRTVYVLRRVQKKQGDLAIYKYRALPVPAISGQSVTNAYGRVLVDLAQLIWGEKAPICDECKNYHKRGGFTKRMDVNIPHDDRVKGCVVEDITGFLAAVEITSKTEKAKKAESKREGQEVPRRTSALWFSYMVPDIDYGVGIIESQFHVQYNFETQQHRPFTIESGSAIYIQLLAIDVDQIGRLRTGYVNDRKERIELAFKSLITLYEGHVYGAKKSRYLPISEILGGIATVSFEIPFMVSKPKMYYGSKTYIEDTVERAHMFVNALTSGSTLKNIEKLKLYITYFDKEDVIKAKPTSKTKSIEIDDASSFSDMINKVLGRTIDSLEQKIPK